MRVDSPEFIDNPYPFYAQRRRTEPVYKAGPGSYSLTGYDVISKVLAHPAAGRGNVGQHPATANDAPAREALRKTNPALRILDDWMLFKNPPEHARLREPVVRELSARTVSQLETTIRQSLREILDGLSADAFDLATDIAYPFPLAVVSDLIGIPRSDRDRFHAWSQDFAYAVQLDFNRLTRSTRDRLNRSAVELAEYFRELVTRKRTGDSGDLITNLAAADCGDGGLSEAEVLANCVFLLFAGHETTASLINNGFHALLRHPDQYRMLADEPSLIPNAVEECLRYDPPIQMVGRYLLEDMAIGEHVFRSGTHLYVFLGAAGRDPAANPEPDDFDIRRRPVRHLAFARGAHHCLGASLARLEARIAFEEIVCRFPDLRPAGSPRRRKTWVIRGFESMPLRTGTR